MGRTTVAVEVDLDDFSDKDIEAEARERGLNSNAKDSVADAINEIRRGDYNDAITTLEREFFPKWGAPSYAMAALAKHKQAERAEPKEWR